MPKRKNKDVTRKGSDAKISKVKLTSGKLLYGAKTEQIEKIFLQATNGPAWELIAENWGLPVSRQDIGTIQENNWLNDHVIDFYFNYLIEKSKGLNAYALSSFFFSTLHTKGYFSVRRWTKNLDLFSNDIILVPICVGNHWTLVSININDKLITMYDSLGRGNYDHLKIIQHYLENEHLDQKRKLKTAEWKQLIATNIPLQSNLSDCGVFKCFYAQCLVNDMPFLFSQEEIPHIRYKMICDIASYDNNGHIPQVSIDENTQLTIYCVPEKTKELYGKSSRQLEINVNDFGELDDGALVKEFEDVNYDVISEEVDNDTVLKEFNDDDAILEEINFDVISEEVENGTVLKELNDDDAILEEVNFDVISEEVENGTILEELDDNISNYSDDDFATFVSILNSKVTKSKEVDSKKSNSK